MWLTSRTAKGFRCIQPQIPDESETSKGHSFNFSATKNMNKHKSRCPVQCRTLSQKTLWTCEGFVTGRDSRLALCTTSSRAIMPANVLRTFLSRCPERIVANLARTEQPRNRPKLHRLPRPMRSAKRPRELERRALNWSADATKAWPSPNTSEQCGPKAKTELFTSVWGSY